MCVCMYIYIYIYICMYVCMYMYVCMHGPQAPPFILPWPFKVALLHRPFQVFWLPGLSKHEEPKALKHPKPLNHLNCFFKRL